MDDPHIAADGFMNETVRSWLRTSRDTSPMTNLQLQHDELIPNHALRSAIQEMAPAAEHGAVFCYNFGTLLHLSHKYASYGSYMIRRKKWVMSGKRIVIFRT